MKKAAVQGNLIGDPNEQITHNSVLPFTAQR